MFNYSRSFTFSSRLVNVFPRSRSPFLVLAVSPPSSHSTRWASLAFDARAPSLDTRYVSFFLAGVKHPLRRPRCCAAGGATGGASGLQLVVSLARATLLRLVSGCYVLERKALQGQVANVRTSIELNTSRVPGSYAECRSRLLRRRNSSRFQRDDKLLRLSTSSRSNSRKLHACAIFPRLSRLFEHILSFLQNNIRH